MTLRSCKMQRQKTGHLPALVSRLIGEEGKSSKSGPALYSTHISDRSSTTFKFWSSSFIEGGQFINLEDVDSTLSDRWRVFLVYHKSSTLPNLQCLPYSFVGYATTYRFYKFHALKSRAATDVFTFPPTQKITPNKLSSRLRISQFLVTPLIRAQDIGSALYQSIYAEVMSDPTIVEMTVEDPSEEFDKLRDMNDFDVLEPQFKAAGIQINDSPFASSDRRRISRVPTAILLPLDKLQEIRSRNKMASRQFARMVEMYLLAQVPHSHRASSGASLTSLKVKGSRALNVDDRRYYWWRLLLKQRIMKKNKDLLQQVALEDRVHRLRTVPGHKKTSMKASCSHMD